MSEVYRDCKGTAFFGDMQPFGKRNCIKMSIHRRKDHRNIHNQHSENNSSFIWVTYFRGIIWLFQEKAVPLRAVPTSALHHATHTPILLCLSHATLALHASCRVDSHHPFFYSQRLPRQHAELDAHRAEQRLDIRRQQLWCLGV